MINNILIIGAGQMGSGIAQVAISAGYQVFVYDVNSSVLNGLHGKLTKTFNKLIEKAKMTEDEAKTYLSRLNIVNNLADTASNIDMVIEAAIEDIDVKIAAFKTLNTICKPETIFATNTSSISITKIAQKTAYPDRVCGMHFFNPVPMMKLLEITRGIQTSDETINAVKEVGIKLNKVIVNSSDSPGFLVNRMLIPMINEAIMLLQENAGNAIDIDLAMKNGANHPMGPLELADLIGNDTVLAIMNVLYNEFQDTKYRPALLLKRMVDSGKLGRKSGEGFYKY